jgi:hypothetical protein
MTIERDHIKEQHEYAKREMIRHSLESSLGMKEEIEVLKEEIIVK